MATRPFPPVYPHGALEEVFADIFLVTGSLAMHGPLPMRFSRNMTVIRQGQSLTLVNSLRLDDTGLAALDALGKVEHVIRLAGFHGMDDPFYKDRYRAKVWVLPDMAYAAGFDAPKTAPEDGYFQPDAVIEADTALPVENASVFSFDCKPGEGLLHLHRDGGVVIAGDSLQNWQTTEYFNRLAKPVMKMLGFMKPHNLGPGWLKAAKPDVARLRALLDLEFDHLLPAHGLPVIGAEREKFRPTIDKLG